MAGGVMFDLTLDTFIVSDTHFAHANIVKYCNRPEDHDAIMLENWLALVQPDDYVLHLGDLFMGKREEAIKLIEQLPGRKWMIKGNHDKQTDVWYRDRGFVLLKDTHLYWTDSDGRRILFSHYPDTTKFDWSINVHGHIHNNGYPPEAPIDRDYRNVSVEVVDYSPVRLRDVLYGISYQSRRIGGTWDGQTRTYGERKGGVIRPTERELAYYGDSS